VNAGLVDEIVEEIATAVADRVVLALASEPAWTTPVSEWRLLTTEDASRALNRSTRWIRQRAKSGDLPWVRLDEGPLAFRLEDLQACAASRRVPADRDSALAARLPLVGEPAPANGRRPDGRPKEPRVSSGNGCVPAGLFDEREHGT
jgi:hypothetical protein